MAATLGEGDTQGRGRGTLRKGGGAHSGKGEGDTQGRGRGTLREGGGAHSGKGRAHSQPAHRPCRR